MRSTFTTELWRTRAAGSESNLDSGPVAPLGTKVEVFADTPHPLYYVKAGAGAATDGDVVGDGIRFYDPAATDEAVEAGPGRQVWVYVKAKAAIRRGEVLIDDAVATPYEVKPYDIASDGAVARVRGVAQHNIPDEYTGWVLVEGVGVVATGGSVDAGHALEPASGNSHTIDAGAAAVNIGYAMTEDGASASGFANVNSKTLAKAFLRCPG